MSVHEFRGHLFDQISSLLANVSVVFSPDILPALVSNQSEIANLRNQCRKITKYFHLLEYFDEEEPEQSIFSVYGYSCFLNEDNPVDALMESLEFQFV